jgi:hypothetical protein
MEGNLHGIVSNRTASEVDQDKKLLPVTCKDNDPALFSGVKRFIIHIMLTILILDTTSLYQVFKVPSLISHFVEHKALNHDISFMDFLSMHYWGDDLNDNDDDKDMQLPFKKFEIQHTSFLFTPFSTSFTFKNTTWPVKADYGPHKPQLHYHAALRSLFRPPQV